VTKLACAGPNRTCVSCGSGGEPCCDGNWCDDGGCCDNSFNVPTCVAAAIGDAAAGTCSQGHGTCSNGGCQGGTCGEIGQPCCGDGVGCTAPYAFCNGNNLCVACGGQNQRCCPAIRGNDWCGEPFNCNGATCQ
jgi:hypothetical protein